MDLRIQSNQNTRGISVHVFRQESIVGHQPAGYEVQTELPTYSCLLS